MNAYCRSSIFLGLAACQLFVRPFSACAEEVQIEKNDTSVVVKLGGKPFTTHLFKSGAKPVLWPIIGPTGKEMTRAYPLREGDPQEKTDHIHQRSLWFTHGNVNGVSFWDENKGHGEIVQRELVSAEGGPTGKIITRNDWVTMAGVKLCGDERTLRFGGDGESRWIDFDVTVTALADEVTFGDTKEGSFGVRVAESMKVDAKQGGRIINAEGKTDKAAWGQASPWVDYHGPVAGETLGVAILNHPSSFRFPTYWHVREYGLFAANVFGKKDFLGATAIDGPHKMNKGESFTLRYRVLLHQGDEKQGRVAEAFTKYAAEKK